MIVLKLTRYKKPNFMFIIFTALIIIFLFMVFTLPHEPNEKTLQIATSLYDENHNEFLQLYTPNDSATFYLDISFLSNFNTSFQVYLLSNFTPIPFSLNDTPKQISHELLVHSSTDFSISRDNKICIDGLTAHKNDLCFIFVGKIDIFTKRFQIVNENSSLTPTYPILQLNTNETFRPIDTRTYNIMFDEKSCNLHILINFTSSLDGNRYQEQFNDGQANFDVAVLAFIEPDNKFYNFGVAKVDGQYIEFSIPLDSDSNYDSLRIIVFPFINQYDDSFLRTYKVSLWSAPICTNKINIERGN